MTGGAMGMENSESASASSNGSGRWNSAAVARREKARVVAGDGNGGEDDRRMGVPPASSAEEDALVCDDSARRRRPRRRRGFSSVFGRSFSDSSESWRDGEDWSRHAAERRPSQGKDVLGDPATRELRAAERSWTGVERRFVRLSGTGMARVTRAGRSASAISRSAIGPSVVETGTGTETGTGIDADGGVEVFAAEIGVGLE